MIKIKHIHIHVSPPTADPDNKINFLQDNTEVIARLNEDKDGLEEALEEQEHANQVLQDRIDEMAKAWELDKGQLKNARNLANNRAHDLEIARRELTNLQNRYKQLGDANSATSQRNAEWMRKHGEKAMRIAEATHEIKAAQHIYNTELEYDQSALGVRLGNALDALAGKTKEGTPDGD